MTETWDAEHTCTDGKWCRVCFDNGFVVQPGEPPSEDET